MLKRLNETLEEIWFAADPAQYLLYGLWTIVLSGNFALQGWHVVFPVAWKMLGVVIVVVTIWGSMQAKQYAILLNAMMAIVVGAIYTSEAMMAGARVGPAAIDHLRGSTQSNYLTLVLMTAWGYYLANLVSRQRREFERAGLADE